MLIIIWPRRTHLKTKETGNLYAVQNIKSQKERYLLITKTSRAGSVSANKLRLIIYHVIKMSKPSILLSIKRCF